MYLVNTFYIYTILTTINSAHLYVPDDYIIKVTPARGRIACLQEFLHIPPKKGKQQQYSHF